MDNMYVSQPEIFENCMHFYDTNHELYTEPHSTVQTVLNYSSVNASAMNDTQSIIKDLRRKGNWSSS